jgi:hypothetical protein
MIIEIQEEEAKQEEPFLPTGDVGQSSDFLDTTIEPEEPVSIEQNINLIVVTTFNDSEPDKTIKALNAALKKLNVASAVYMMDNVTEVGKEELAKQIPTQPSTPPVDEEPYEEVKDLDLENA